MTQSASLDTTDQVRPPLESAKREHHGRILLALRSVPSFIDAARELINILPDEHNFQVRFPPGALESLRAGKEILSERKDGSGLAVTLQDADSKKFTRQVTLYRENGAQALQLANALRALATQASIEKMLNKLEIIDIKISQIINMQVAAWRGDARAAWVSLRDASNTGDINIRNVKLVTAERDLRRILECCLDYVESEVEANAKRIEPSVLNYIPLTTPPDHARELLSRVEWAIRLAAISASGVVAAGSMLNEAYTDPWPNMKLRLEALKPTLLSAWRIAPHNESREIFWKDHFPAVLAAHEVDLLDQTTLSRSELIDLIAADGDSDDKDVHYLPSSSRRE